MTTDPQTAAFDAEVRAYIYDHTMRRDVPPTVAHTARALQQPRTAIRDAYARLDAGHILVLDEDGERITMALPFSGVPTPFVVRAGRRAYWGNCMWDALGIVAMIEQQARILTSCADCSNALTVWFTNGALAGDDGVVHFALPARHWWDNIRFT